MNLVSAAHHPVANALTNAVVGLAHLAAWGLLMLVIVAVGAMLLLSAVATEAQASQIGATSAALVMSHRVEAVAVHGEDGDRYVAVRVVGLACPVERLATVRQLAESARASGYMADIVGYGDEVRVRPNYARLAY